jgi:hypothetical protein
MLKLINVLSQMDQSLVDPENPHNYHAVLGANIQASARIDD